MPNIIPVFTSFESRWKPEIVARPDVVEVSGQLRDVMRNVKLKQELRIRFDWFEVGGSSPLFYREFVWGAEEQPANEFMGLRVAASELIGLESTFATIAQTLFELAEPELAPAQESQAFAMSTFISAFPVGRLKVYLPLANSAERSVEIDVHHYLDSACKQIAFKRTKQWLARQVIESRALENETPCEELLTSQAIAPLVLTTLRECGELVQGIYPTFSVDLDAWLALAADTLAAFNPS